MLCIICDKEFSAVEQIAEDRYSHAEAEHGLSKEDYDKVDNYVLEGDDEGGNQENSRSPPSTVDVEQPPNVLLCIVCEVEFRKGEEERL